GQRLHDLGALGGDQARHGTLAEFVAHTGVDELLDARARLRLQAVDRQEILAHVEHAPLHERADQEVFLFLGRDRLCADVERQYARVEVARVVHERDLAVQPRRLVRAQYLPETHDDDPLALVDAVEREQHRHDGEHEHTEYREQPRLVHHGPPRWRRSLRPRGALRGAAAPSPSGVPAAGADGSLAPASRGAVNLSIGRYSTLPDF